MSSKTKELNDWVSSLKPRSREKKYSNNSKGIKLTGKVGGEKVNNTGSGGVQQAAAAKDKERRISNMKRDLAKQREIKADPEKTAAQKKINEEVDRKIQVESNLSRITKEAPDYATMSDYAQDYVPLDDSIGKAINRGRIQSAYRKRNSGK